MLIDNDLLMSDAQALTATALSTNVIDLSAVAPSIGDGEPVAVIFSVGVAADQTTGDEDYTFDVEVASDTGITTARELLGRRVFESGTPTAPAQDADLLVAGYTFMIPIPAISFAETERYLAVRYTLAGTSPTITVDAWLAPQSSYQSKASDTYPNGYDIT